jgi:hypothetical protein
MMDTGIARAQKKLPVFFDKIKNMYYFCEVINI